MTNPWYVANPVLCLYDTNLQSRICSPRPQAESHPLSADATFILRRGFVSSLSKFSGGCSLWGPHPAQNSEPNSVVFRVSLHFPKATLLACLGSVQSPLQVTALQGHCPCSPVSGPHCTPERRWGSACAHCPLGISGGYTVSAPRVPVFAFSRLKSTSFRVLQETCLKPRRPAPFTRTGPCPRLLQALRPLQRCPQPTSPGL